MPIESKFVDSKKMQDFSSNENENKNNPNESIKQNNNNHQVIGQSSNNSVDEQQQNNLNHSGHHHYVNNERELDRNDSSDVFMANSSSSENQEKNCDGSDKIIINNNNNKGQSSPICLIPLSGLHCIGGASEGDDDNNYNNDLQVNETYSISPDHHHHHHHHHNDHQRRAPLDNVGLLYYNREPLRLKDFASEIRASMDVEQFAHQAELLLDSDAISMEEIVDSMLERIIRSEQMSLVKLNALKESLFVKGSSLLMAHTIQGVLADDDVDEELNLNQEHGKCSLGCSRPVTFQAAFNTTSEKNAGQTTKQIKQSFADLANAEDNNNNNNNSSSIEMPVCCNGQTNKQQQQQQRQQQSNLKHDQSWLCALSSLAQISRRHMVIARFRLPINMGENAHHVRLFVLILVPTNEKSTKDQLETGRTFATMLTSSSFRRHLLEANSENEFKSLMICRAQQMAKLKEFKNRHKYLLDAALHQSISTSQLANLAGDDLQVGFNVKGGRGGGGGVQLNHHHQQLAGQRKPTSLTSYNSNSTSPHGDCYGSELDHSSPSPLMFDKNPRTSKLFQLILQQQQQQQQQQLHSSKSDNNNNNKVSTMCFEKNSEITNSYIGSGGEKDNNNSSSNNDSSAKQKSCFGGGFCKHFEFGSSCWQDFRRRLSYYPSDFRDAFIGPPRTLQKTISTIWFLYFGILLPTIAFSSLNTTQTHGHMGDLRKALIGQAIGGLGFALLSGQPLVIVMTTAPLCLYTKVIHQMCLDYQFPFPAMYAAVGLWNGFFLVLYSMFGFSRLMRWCTRSTEEIFALFIVVAFITDASKDMMKNFRRFYFTPACSAQNNQTSSMMLESNRTLAGHSLVTNATQNDSGYRDIEEEIESSVCRRETSLLFVLLMLGTLWLSVTLYKFRKTQYLSAGKRDLLADYALPTAVILMSVVGSIMFNDIYVEKFPPLVDIHFERAPIETLPVSGILTALVLGFTLSLLFFMDQNISAAMVNTPQNRLKKGDAFHYDLLVVAILNGVLTMYGLPMMHGVLPHSPLHARSLADIEEQVEDGHLREVVVNARETRVTAIVAHVLLFGSLLLIPYPIAYIPRAVLNGLFLYMAITSLDGLQVFERIMLLFTEQNKYPPNHYIRRCPQRKIHQFTFMQLIQLLVMCLFGFSPINVVEMFFPVIILLMIPFRHKVVPKYIDEKYLASLDGKH